MARGVDEVNRAVLPGERYAGAVDRDAAFLFFLVPVGLGGACIDLAEAVRRAGIEEEGVR